jgi:predicted nucleic-acid-binding protein
MIAVDTNILARFYVDDPADAEAHRQRPIARQVMGAASIFVPASVLLELEWVLRALYQFGPLEFATVVNHLLGLPNVVIEARASVAGALDAHVAGLDFADALHLCSSRQCVALMTFDDRRFARKAHRLGLLPSVTVAS